MYTCIIVIILIACAGNILIKPLFNDWAYDIHVGILWYYRILGSVEEHTAALVVLNTCIDNFIVLESHFCVFLYTCTDQQMFMWY